MKTFHLILGLLPLALGAHAQLPPPATPRPTPVQIPTRTNRVPGLTNLTAAAATNAARATFPAPATATAPVVRPAAAAPVPAGPAAAAVVPTPAPAVPVAAAPAVPGVPPAAPGLAAPAPAGAPAAGDFGDGGDVQVLPPGLIKFSGVDLDQVLDFYQELSGRTILRPTALPQTKITIKSQTELTRKEAIQAMDSILSLNQITMIPQGTKFVKAVPMGQAGQEAAGFAQLNSSTNLPDAGQYVTYVTQVKNAKPSELIPALQPLQKLPQAILAIDSSGILVLRDYAENVKRMLELIEKIDVVPPTEIKSVVIPIKYALAGDIATVLGSLTAGGGGITSVGQRQPLSGSGLSQPGLGGQRGGVGGLGGGGVGGVGGYNQGVNQFGQTGVGGVGNTGGGLGSTTGGAAGTRNAFQNRLRSIIGGGGSGDIFILGQSKIIADERTNSLLVFASEQDISAITNIIAKLDVVLAQVLIESVIMDVGIKNDLSYGVSYVQNPYSRGRFTGAGGVNNGQSFANFANFGTLASNSVSSLPSGFSYFGRINNDLDVAVEALASDSRGVVLSRPRIQTSHAVPCRIFVGESRPYITGTGFGFSGTQQSQVAQLRIGIDLSVTPLVNVDGLVVMDIEQRIDSATGSVTIDGNQVPVTTERSASAKVSIHNRETVMLGGFISNNRNNSKSGVPLLKDIPLFGALFRSSSKTYDRSELIVLIRPTVLPTPKDAALSAIEEKSKLPGILRAEREEMETERKALNEANRGLYRKEGFGQMQNPGGASAPMADRTFTAPDSTQPTDAEVRRVLDKAYATPPETVVVPFPMDGAVPAPASVAPVPTPAPASAPVTPTDAEIRPPQDKATRDLYRREGFKQ